MNKTTHAPLPAQVELSIGSEGTEYKNEDGEPIETQAVLFDGDSGTIAYVLTDLAAWREIAQALHDRYNSHDRLVEALTNSTDWIMSAKESIRRNYGDSNRLHLELGVREAANRALLAELEGKA